MKIAIVYDKERARGNERFSILLNKGLNKCGAKGQIFIGESPEIFDCDGVVMRTLDSGLSERLELKGIPVFNNLKTQITANDKAKTYELLKEIEVPFIPYELYSSSKQPSNFPFIIKAADGHGGTEVFCVKNPDEWLELKSNIDFLSKKYLIQRVADKPDDKRVYVIGGELIVAMKRVNRYSFKSNYKLGGTAAIVSVTQEERDYIARIYEYLRCDYVGIDFLTYNGKSVVNEIEDIVGSRMVYENTEIDILDRYAEYIVGKIKQ